jgi:hypothetical protein
MRITLLIFIISLLLLSCQSKPNSFQQTSDTILTINKDEQPQTIAQVDSTPEKKLQFPDSSDGSFEKLIDKITFSPDLKKDKSFLPIKKASYDTIRMNESVCTISLGFYYKNLTIKQVIKSNECRAPYLIEVTSNILTINDKVIDLEKLISQNGNSKIGHYLYYNPDYWERFSLGNNHYLPGYFYHGGCTGTFCLVSFAFLYEINTKNFYVFENWPYPGFFCDIDNDSLIEFLDFEIMEGHPYAKELKTTFKLTLFELNPHKQHFELVKDSQGNPYFIEISFDNGMFTPRNAKITKSHWFKPLPSQN